MIRHFAEKDGCDPASSSSSSSSDEGVDVVGTVFAFFREAANDPEYEAKAREVWNGFEDDTGKAVGKIRELVLGDKSGRDNFVRDLLGAFMGGGGEDK